MRHTTIGCIISLALSLLSAPCLADAQQVVFLVRHGEQASGANDDPPLTEAGQRRARALETVLKDAGLTAIYVSELQRTMQPPSPWRRPCRSNPRACPGVTSRPPRQLHTQHADGRVLIISHSLTIPRRAQGLRASRGGRDPA